MKRLLRLLAATGIVAALFLNTVSPALAIDVPDPTFVINRVDAYNSLAETDDQLYLVDYTIDYDPDTDPLTDDNPAENITEAFLVRLMDGTDQLGSQAPYAYYDDGYDRGVVSIYFTASDPNLPTWADPYTLSLEGNPTLTWNPSRPETSTTGINWNTSSDQAGALAARILYLADQLEQAWSVDMIETSGFGDRLTSYGESYFSNVIPYLSVMCPSVLSGSSTNPEIVERANERGAETYLTGRTAGTILDMTDPAAEIGISPTTLGIGISFLITIIGLTVFARAIPGSGLLTLMSVPLLIMFTLMGLIPLGITIVISVFAMVMTIYIFTLEKSSA